MPQEFKQGLPVEATDIQSSEIRKNFDTLYAQQAGAVKPNEAVEGAAWYVTDRRHMRIHAGTTYSTTNVVNTADVCVLEEDFWGTKPTNTGFKPWFYSSSGVIDGSASYPEDMGTVIRMELTLATTPSYHQITTSLNPQINDFANTKPRMQCIASGSVTTGYLVYMGFGAPYAPGIPHVFVGFTNNATSGPGTQYVATVNTGATSTEVSTGVAVDETFRNCEIVGIGDNGVQFLIDDAVVATISSPSVTFSLYPIFRVENVAATTGHHLDIDYVRVEYLR